MPPLVPVDLPYLDIFRAKGRLFAYYRRGGARVRLLDAEGRPVDPEDRAALAAAWTRQHEKHEATRVPGAGARPAETRDGSVAHAIALYRASDDWRAKKPSTRTDYEKGLTPLEADFGAYTLRAITPVHVRKIRNRYRTRELRQRDGTPVLGDDRQPQRVANNRQANRVVSVLSVLCEFARKELGWISTNPCANPDRLPAQTKGYRPWPLEAFQAFCDQGGPEWTFRALFALLTAQRGQDQVAVRWDAYDGHGIRFVQQKGGDRVEVYVTVAGTPLKRELDARKKRARALTILESAQGTPWDRVAYSTACSRAIAAAGLRGLTWHGLRGAAASWAADEGADQKAAQALLGHSTPTMTAHYARGAEQRRMAERASKAIVSRLRRGRAASKKRAT